MCRALLSCEMMTLYNTAFPRPAIPHQGLNMRSSSAKDLIGFDIESAPQLIVFIDAEEEFQWDTFSPGAISVRNMAAQGPAQDIMNAFGIQPTYLADYAVASQPDGIEPLKAMLEAQVCTVGA